MKRELTRLPAATAADGEEKDDHGAAGFRTPRHSSAGLAPESANATADESETLTELGDVVFFHNHRGQEGYLSQFYAAPFSEDYDDFGALLNIGTADYLSAEQYLIRVRQAPGRAHRRTPSWSRVRIPRRTPVFNNVQNLDNNVQNN